MPWSCHIPTRPPILPPGRCPLQVAPLWYLAQYTFNLSLAHTSVTSNTVLSSASSLFTFLLSVWLLAERFTLKKLACILLLMAGATTSRVVGCRPGGGGVWEGNWRTILSGVCRALAPGAAHPGGQGNWRTLHGQGAGRRNSVPPAASAHACAPLSAAGTAIYTLADTKSSGKNTLWGDLLVLASAVLYASYTITIRMSLADDEQVSQTRTARADSTRGCATVGIPASRVGWQGSTGAAHT